MIDAESGDCSSTDGDPRWSRRLGETAEVDVEIARHIDELCSQPLVSALHCMCDRKLRPQNGYLGGISWIKSRGLYHTKKSTYLAARHVSKAMTTDVGLFFFGCSSHAEVQAEK